LSGTLNEPRSSEIERHQKTKRRRGDGRCGETAKIGAFKQKAAKIAEMNFFGFVPSIPPLLAAALAFAKRQTRNAKRLTS
jgi:hypothetical protein